MSVLDVDLLKDDLNITEVDDDAELIRFIARAEASLGKRVGPLAPTAITDRLNPAWGSPLVVSTLPAISLTSVTPVIGSVVDVTTLDLDPETGIIRMKGTTERYWSEFRSRFVGPYTVVYQAGYATLPADLEAAGMLLVAHLWETQRRTSGQRGSTPATTDIRAGATRLTYPTRVLELIEPYTQIAI